jgi:hypothetical protein
LRFAAFAAIGKRFLRRNYGDAANYIAVVAEMSRCGIAFLRLGDESDLRLCGSPHFLICDSVFLRFRGETFLNER